MLLIPLVCLTLAASTQTLSPAERVARARATYYTPTAGGLASFHCDVVFDWKDLFTRLNGTPVADDDPFLRYLSSTHLSVTDDLHGNGVLEWSNTATPPEDKAARAAQLKNGLQQMIGGFFESWNEFVNGDMFPDPDRTLTVTATDTGYLLHSAAGDPVDEKFDSNMLLTEVHIAMKDADVVTHPKYVDTEHGRMISVIQAVSRTLPSGPSTELTIRMEYLPVSSFQIPSVMTVDVENIGVIRMKFTQCSVKTADAAPHKP